MSQQQPALTATENTQQSQHQSSSSSASSASQKRSSHCPSGKQPWDYNQQLQKQSHSRIMSRVPNDNNNLDRTEHLIVYRREKPQRVQKNHIDDEEEDEETRDNEDDSHQERGSAQNEQSIMANKPMQLKKIQLIPSKRSTFNFTPQYYQPMGVANNKI